MLLSMRCLPGFALDLSTVDEHGRPWDFDIEENRQRAKQMVLEQKPGLLIGTPMCTAFSAWQRINNQRRDPNVVCREYERALTHLSFCCELYNIQIAAGRHFLHEHPQQAQSWSEKVVRQLLDKPGVDKVTAHQCQFGACDAKGLPLKKPTCFMTNSSAIRNELEKTCVGRYGFCSFSSRGRAHQMLRYDGATAGDISLLAL